MIGCPVWAPAYAQHGARESTGGKFSLQRSAWYASRGDDLGPSPQQAGYDHGWRRWWRRGRLIITIPIRHDAHHAHGRHPWVSVFDGHRFPSWAVPVGA